MAVPGTPELKSALKKPDADAPKYFVVRALDKFTGKVKDEISFEKKDLILVLEENAAEGKYRGEVIKGGKVKNEKTGWFPSFYARKDPNEKLPELPPSLQPKKRVEGKVEMTVPSVELSRKSTNSSSDVASSKSTSPGGSLRGAPGAEGGEEKPSLTEMRKRFGGSRATTIRTLKLMNDETAEAEEDEPDTPDTPEPDASEDPKDKGQYMQGVASKMVSKLAFMQSKKKGSKNVAVATDPGKKSGIFSSLRKSKDSRSSSVGEDNSGKKKSSGSGSGSGSAPNSAPGTEKDKHAKTPLPSAAAISERLSKANADAAALEESQTGLPRINEPNPSPRGTNDALRQSRESLSGIRPSKSTGDLGGDHKSVAFDATTPNKGSVRSRKGSRAVIVEEDDTPTPQSAAVQQFNPEGKNIEIIAEIGKGATGCVWKGCIDGEFVALKQISLMNVKNVKNMRQALKEEVETMKGFNHPNILKYYAMFYSRVNQEINIVLELVEGILAAKLVAKQKPISEPLAAQVIYQLLDALKFLVRQNIVHRDVKPQNMLINTDGIVKLIDFGTVARLSASATHRNSTVGTPWYVAPEVINGDDYGYTADVWSVGCTLLEFVTGKPPYHDQNSVAALYKMVEEPHPPVPTNLTKECTEFLNACFKRDHKTRIMAHTCQDTPFVQARASQAELARVVGTIHTVPKDDGGFDL